MGCFSCISPPSKDVSYDGGDIVPRSANSSGLCFLVLVFGCIFLNLSYCLFVICIYILMCLLAINS